jgi:hypothetical protein
MPPGLLHALLHDLRRHRCHLGQGAKQSPSRFPHEAHQGGQAEATRTNNATPSIALKQGEPFTNDQRVVRDLLIGPKLFMPGTPLPNGFEALALVTCELQVHIPCADHAQLGGLHYTQRLVVIPEQNKTLAGLWQLHVRIGLVFFAQTSRRNLFATKNRRDELSAQLGAAVAQL